MGTPTEGDENVAGPNDAPAQIELLREPAGVERLAAETVTLELRPDGDLVLSAHATGVAVEMIMGEGLNDSLSSWTVSAAQVPRVLDAVARDLFADTSAIRGWLGARGIPAVEEDWRGYGVRPVDESRFLLEALRDIIGTQQRDEGQQIATRLIDWLTRNGFRYEFGEQVREAY